MANRHLDVYFICCGRGTCQRQVLHQPAPSCKSRCTAGQAGVASVAQRGVCVVVPLRRPKPQGRQPCVVPILVLPATKACLCEATAAVRRTSPSLTCTPFGFPVPLPHLSSCFLLQEGIKLENTIKITDNWRSEWNKPLQGKAVPTMPVALSAYAWCTTGVAPQPVSTPARLLPPYLRCVCCIL